MAVFFCVIFLLFAFLADELIAGAAAQGADIAVGQLVTVIDKAAPGANPAAHLFQRAVHGCGGRNGGSALAQEIIHRQHPAIAQDLAVHAVTQEQHVAAHIHGVHHLAGNAGYHALLDEGVALTVGKGLVGCELISDAAGLISVI